MPQTKTIWHLQKNGYSQLSACNLSVELRTWNLVQVTCKVCRKTAQYRDSKHFQDIGSPGREIQCHVQPLTDHNLDAIVRS